jgi:hypothetical protein
MVTTVLMESVRSLRTCPLVVLDENNPGNKLSDKDLTGLLMELVPNIWAVLQKNTSGGHSGEREKESTRGRSRLYHRQSTSIAFYTIELYDIKCSVENSITAIYSPTILWRSLACAKSEQWRRKRGAKVWILNMRL